MRISTREEPFRHTFNEPLPALFQIVLSAGAESSKGEAHIIDLSPGGMKLNTAFNFPKEAVNSFDLLIFFRLNDKELMYYGSVVWRKNRGSSFDYGIDLNMRSTDEKELIEELKKFSRKHMLSD